MPRSTAAAARNVRALPDGRLVIPPRRAPDGTLQDDDVLRYMTRRQQMLLNWCLLPWVMIPLLFFAFLFRNGFRHGSGVPIRFANPGDAALILCFVASIALIAIAMFVQSRILARVDAQIYEPEG